MNYERPLFKTLKALLLKKSHVIHAIIGPRQVGKTTIAKQIQESIGYPVIYGTADSPVQLDYSWIETQWRRAASEYDTSGGPVMLILDELQKVPGWSETLKMLWDNQRAGKDIRVIILGSSALLMQEGLTESLAGRFLLHRCSHWGYAECREAFGWGLEKWLYFGGYPGASVFIDDEPTWKRYISDSLIETVLARDVLQMSRISKPALLRHLFALAATLPAQTVSYTKMLGQLHDAGNTTTLAHYIRLLEAAFLLSGLELFSKNVQRKRGSSPKLVLWNNALINAISTKTFSETISDSVWWGRIVENAVGSHLCNNLNSVEYDITYWREKNFEVDFIISRGSKLWAVEVKSGRSHKAPGLQRFRDLYPKASAMLVGRPGIPLEDFLNSDPREWFS